MRSEQAGKACVQRHGFFLHVHGGPQNVFDRYSLRPTVQISFLCHISFIAEAIRIVKNRGQEIQRLREAKISSSVVLKRKPQADWGEETRPRLRTFLNMSVEQSETLNPVTLTEILRVAQNDRVAGWGFRRLSHFIALSAHHLLPSANQ